MTERAVTITFTGPLAAGPLDVSVALPVVEAFGDALRLMIRHHHAEVTGNRPPYPGLLSASALRLASVSVGSYSVTLELAEPMALGKLDDAPVDGLKALLSDANADVRGLPTEVAFSLRRIVEGLPDGVNGVVITGPAGLPELKLTRELFDDGPPQSETFRCYGRLQEINWSRGTARLNSPIDTCLLAFPGTMAEKMQEAGDRYIRVKGIGERTSDGIIIIREIEAIEIVEERDRMVRKHGPFEKDVEQALAIIRWEEKQREWFYDDELDAWADELLKDSLKE